MAGVSAEAGRQVYWRGCKRGVRAALVALILGPLVGGFVFGMIFVAAGVAEGLTNIVVLGTTGKATGLAVIQGLVDAIKVFFGGMLLLPVILAQVALFLPPAWLAAGIAALYVGPRVGITGRLGWLESAVLALVCSAVLVVGFRLLFQLPGYVFPIMLVASTVAAGLIVRYILGRYGMLAGTDGEGKSGQLPASS